jgi:hypothetical protein
MMGLKFLISILLILLIPFKCVISQVDEDELVQFTGIVVTADSLIPVPYTNISIKNTWRGAIADYYGYFSFVAFKSDTVIFSAVGFKKGVFTIPDTITANRYSLIQVMASDTIMLTQTVIYPWPSKENFKDAFLKFDVPDDDYERAKKNLDIAQLRNMAVDYPMDGSMNFRNSMQLYQSKLYYNGQTQPISILNPFAWAEFIKAWKEGKFKRKNKD